MREDHPTVPEETGASSKSTAFSSIQGRLVSLLLFVLVPILVAQAYFSYDRYQSARRVEVDANLDLARATAKAFDTFVQDVLHQELAIGLAFTSSQTLSEEEKSRILLENQAENQAIWHFFWDTPGGIVAAATGSQFIGMDVSDREFYREIVAGKDWVVSDLLLSKTTQQPSFTISRGIRNERGELLGIIVAGILPAKLDRVLAVKRPGDAGVSLLDSRGMNVYRYPASQYTWEQRNWLKLYPFLEQVAKGKEFVDTSHESKIRRGTKRIVAFTPVPSIGWIASCSRSEKETVGPIILATLQETGLILLVALISLLTAFALSRTISSSVKILRNHALSIGRGGKDNPLTISRPTEIRDLAEAFNKMAEELRFREEALRESALRWAVTLSSIGDAVIASDMNGRVTFMNPVAEKLTGWSLAEAAGRPVQEVFRIVNEYTRAVVDDPVSKVLQTSLIVGLANHTVLLRKGGGELPIDHSGAPIRNAEGRVFGVVLIFRDITERKQAGEALRESEEQFRVLTQNLVSAVALINERGEISIVNKSFLRLFDLAEDADILNINSRDWGQWQVFDEAGRLLDADEHPVRKAARTRTAVRDVLVAVQCPGRTDRKWVLISTEPILDEQGNLHQLICTYHDITAHRQAEEALGESEERFRLVLKNSPVLVAMQDSNLVYQWAFNTRTQRPEDVVGKTDADLFAPEDMPSILEAKRRVLQTGEVVSHELWLTSNGQRVFLDCYYEPVWDSAGKIIGVGIAAVNLTEQKQAEEALRESEERLRLLGDNLPDSAVYQYVHEPDGSVRFVNYSAGIERLNGVRVEDVLSEPGTLHRQIPQEYIERLVEAEARSKHELSDFDMELPMCRPDGQVRWMRLHSRPRRMPDGRTIWDGVQTDITERKRVEKTLQQLNQTLEQRVSERTELAEARARQLQVLAMELIEAEERERRRMADLLHDDLQQSLAAARMQLQGASECLPPDPMLANVEQILGESLQKARRLSHELSPAVLHHSGLVASLEWLVRQMKEQFGLHVRLESDGTQQSESTPLKVFLFRAVQELLFNVVKHAGVKTAQVALSSSDGCFAVSVTDQGQGFDPRILDSITSLGGFGLLSLRERANYIGGSFGIESAPGKGSRFTLTVPVSLAKAEKIDPPATDLHNAISAEPTLPADTGGIRVLFVDDHHVMRKGLIRLMSGQPVIHVVGEASNGQEAIEKVRQLKPGVVMMDVSMPVMDGIEATRRIRAEWPEVRVIGLSMYDDENTSQKMRDAGAEIFMSKTASPAELLKAIYGTAPIRTSLPLSKW
jgi:PAS domain S-box-containing protein